MICNLSFQTVATKQQHSLPQWHTYSFAIYAHEQVFHETVFADDKFDESIYIMIYMNVFYINVYSSNGPITLKQY